MYTYIYILASVCAPVCLCVCLCIYVCVCMHMETRGCHWLSSSIPPASYILK